MSMSTVHLTTAEAAAILSVDPSRIRVLCRSGRLGRKFGRDWVISNADVARYLKIGPRKSGRKGRKD